MSKGRRRCALWAVVVVLCACATAQPAGSQAGQAGEAGRIPARELAYRYAPRHLDLAPGLASGVYVRERTRRAEAGSGSTHWERAYAIVGETPDAWHVEMQILGPPPIDGEDTLIGLTVRKADGGMARVVVGEPGTPGESVELATAAPAPPQRPEDAAPVEMVRTPFGEVKTRRHVGEPSRDQERVVTTTWWGVEGSLAGLLIQSQALGRSRSTRVVLEEPPEKVPFPVDGAEFGPVRCRYSDGRVVWLSDAPAIATLFPAAEKRGAGYVRSVQGSITRELVGYRRDVRPRLVW
jgi:hypothetical protein